MDLLPSSQLKAPRFCAYLKHAHNRSLLLITRDTWQALKPHQGEPVIIDVSLTPMADVAKDAVVIAAAAQCISSSGVEIAIYRSDPKDTKPYNVDLYSVWENLPSHVDYHSMVVAASTEDNENLRSFLDKNVFIVSQKQGPDHWPSAEELPTVVQTVVQTRGSKGAP
jgi:hypothetical protein